MGTKIQEWKPLSTTKNHITSRKVGVSCHLSRTETAVRLGDGISWEASQYVEATTTGRNQIKIPQWAGYPDPQLFDSIRYEVDLAFAVGVFHELPTDD